MFGSIAGGGGLAFFLAEGEIAGGGDARLEAGRVDGVAFAFAFGVTGRTVAGAAGLFAGFALG